MALEKSPTNASQPFSNNDSPHANSDIIHEKSTPIGLDETLDSNAPVIARKRSLWQSIFYGGYGTQHVGRRIGPVLPHLKGPRVGDVEVYSGSDSESDILRNQIELEKDKPLQYRSCSWQTVRLNPLFLFISQDESLNF